MLALCIWREGRGEPFRGKLLIGTSVRNRMEDTNRRWPTTIVGVITQRLQFSAFNANDPNVTKYPAEDSQDWIDCVAAADAVLSVAQPVSTCNHYHTKQVTPTWADPAKIVAQEGNHIFYRL